MRSKAFDQCIPRQKTNNNKTESDTKGYGKDNDRYFVKTKEKKRMYQSEITGITQLKWDYAGHSSHYRWNTSMNKWRPWAGKRNR